MQKDKICSFFGHRKIDFSDELYNLTYTEIKRALEFGCNTFYFGGYGEFDELCYKIVTEIKVNNPNLDIKRIYCVARENYLYKKVPYFKREDYDQITFLLPSFNGWYKSIYFRNCAIIDNSDYVVFYAKESENSGAYKAYKHSKRQKNKYIINLYN